MDLWCTYWPCGRGNKARVSVLRCERARERASTHLDAELLHGLRREERADLGDDGAVEAAQDDLVALVQVAVDEDDVDGGAETLDDLDLEDSALERRDVHKVVGHALLGELDEEHEQVGDTLARVGRRRHERHVLAEVLVVVVRHGVEPLLRKGDDRVGEALLVLALDGAVLLGERLEEAAVLHRGPAVQAVDLVERDDEGRLAVAEEADRLEGLRLEAVHDVDHEDGNVAQRRATLAQIGERLVTGRVDDE